ncbi:nucleoside deaminase [Neorhodopirellula lusitana]|uniref:nucleoside deaminase n=1 Tax=Neorhodopirellula lusitana TaxID=445327 RepID=UPI0038500108
MTSSSNVPDSELSHWMDAVLNVARQGVQIGQHPFGAGVFDNNGTPISLEHNQVAATHNPSLHAEVNAIAAACRSLGKTKLNSYWIVSTAEPCPMCMSTIATAGIRQVAYGAAQTIVIEAGFGSLGVTGTELAKQFSFPMTLRGSIRREECDQLLLDNRKDK